MLEPRHVLFTYLHLAPDPELTAGLVASGATCIAYETVTDPAGRLPLLAPMSEVAGKLAAQSGAFMLGKPLGGRGLLLGGVPGVAAGRVMVIGGGVVGQNAARDRPRPRRRGLPLRPLDRPPARARHRLRRPGLHLLRLGAGDRAAPARGRPGDRRRPRPRRPGAARDLPRAAGADEAAARSSSTSRSTRAAALRPRTRRPTPTPPTRSTGSATTASPTCPAPSRSPRPGR